MPARKGVAEGAAVAAAAAAVAVTYGIYAVHPWQGSTPLNQFLAAFGRADTAAWPMQIVWYLAAVAMVGLALRPVRRSSQLICALAAAYFAWIGIGYFAMLAAALVTAGWIIWRDRASGPAWHTVTAGLLFALMIAWSGHDSVLIGLAVVLLAVMLVRAITGHLRRPHADPVSPPQPGKLKVS